MTRALTWFGFDETTRRTHQPVTVNDDADRLKPD